jgi:hemerythrin
MQTITWTGEMELGLPDIDDAHRLLLDQFARTAGASDEDFHATFCTLVDTIEADFREEEALMEDIEDLALNAHRFLARSTTPNPKSQLATPPLAAIVSTCCRSGS